MSELAVRCETCGTISRVPALAAGKMAICPRCRAEFVIPESARPPRLSATPPPALARSEPVIPTVYPLRSPEPPTLGLLYGLAISAFLVPLAWLLLRAFGMGPPVFTLGLPLAIAFAAAGLGIGVAQVDRWSFSTRFKAIAALVLLAWGLAAFGFFLKAAWVETIRRDFNLQGGPWRDFSADGFEVKMPGLPRPGNHELVQGWGLITYQYAERGDRTLVLTVGHGRPDEAKATDDQFFDAARDGAVAAVQGTLIGEKAMLLQGQPGREFVIRLPDNATNRTLRIYRVGTRAVAAVAEGPFLTPEARDAQRFFNSLKLRLGR